MIPLQCHSSDRPRTGIVAGWGRYPIVVARALKAQGHEVSCLAVKGHADPVLREICDDYFEVGLGKMGAAIRYFHGRGVKRATMAGKIHKVLMFERLAWLKHLPDWQFVRTFYRHFITGSKDRKDDTIILAVVEAFAAEGITFRPATDFVPEVLVKFGRLSGRRLSSAQRRDVEFGWRLAKEMGRLDIGQSVAVKGLAVLAVEAIEGTDRCIRRAGELCPSGGFTVVKVAKPQQDMRFDVPTIGLGTLRTLAEAGGRLLVVEAEKTILIDREEVVRFANRRKITLLALSQDHLGQLAEAA